MCPDRELLSAYVDGEVPNPWRERIVDHLRSCPSCTETAAGFIDLGLKLRAEGRIDEDAVLERVRKRLDVEFARHAGRPVVRKGFRLDPYGALSRSVSLPLPVVAAAAVLIVFLAGVTAIGAFRQGSKPVLAAADMPPMSAQPTSMDALLQYLDSKDAQVTLTIRLPSGASLENAGSPMIMRSSDSRQGIPVSSPPLDGQREVGKGGRR
jgi:hypothetical protein